MTDKSYQEIGLRELGFTDEQIEQMIDVHMWGDPVGAGILFRHFPPKDGFDGYIKRMRAIFRNGIRKEEKCKD